MEGLHMQLTGKWIEQVWIITYTLELVGGVCCRKKNPLTIILKYTIYIYTNDSSEIL